MDGAEHRVKTWYLMDGAEHGIGDLVPNGWCRAQWTNQALQLIAGMKFSWIDVSWWREETWYLMDGAKHRVKTWYLVNGAEHKETWYLVNGAEHKETWYYWMVLSVRRLGTTNGAEHKETWYYWMVLSIRRLGTLLMVLSKTTQVYKFGCDWSSELECNYTVQSQEWWGIVNNKLRVWTRTFDG
jgi:hypothetical protein